MILAKAPVPPNFLDLLVLASEKKETAKIYVYYRGATQIHTGILYLLEGSLAGARFEQVKGVEAVHNLLHSAIVWAMSVKVAKGEIVHQDAMPRLDTIIASLRNEGGVALAPCQLSGCELFQAVATTLADLLGDKGERNVEEIAVNYPPHEYPHQFVEECTKMLGHFMGAKRARELLSSLML